MKIRYLITGLLVSALAAVSCAKPDDLVKTDSDVSNLTVNGFLASDKDKANAYPSVVDMAAKTITIQVPWFISDTEEIQADLTQMKLVATLPWGTMFEPGISGIHNLQTGIQRTLAYNDGTNVDFTIKAVYVKSSKAGLSKVFLEEAPNAPIAIREPETEGGDGTIIVYKTSSSIDGAMKSATLTVSPWATFETTALNPDGTVDLSLYPDIYVTAQDGVTKRKYVTVIDMPSFVDPGKVGYISLLFGFQTSTANPYGFVATQNRSMAIAGNYLVVSSTALDFEVFNRYSGVHLTDVQVNTTGLLDGVIHAITNDEAGHMVAISFAALNTAGITNNMFEIYVWKNGITNAPDKVYSEDIGGAAFAAFRSKNNGMATTATWNIGRTVAVKGDITGTAMLMTLANGSNTALLLRAKFDNGVVQPVSGSLRDLTSWNVQSKPIPLSTNDECAFWMCSSDANMRMIYTPETIGSNTVYTKGAYAWWPTRLIGMDYARFNGLDLLAVQNVSGTPPQYCRLCVGDVSTGSYVQIMDSRLDNYDPAFGAVGPGGNNYSITGMTSFYGALWTNPNGTGDVRIINSEDGNAVQVYMLTTDHGIIAYELTRYDI